MKKLIYASLIAANLALLAGCAGGNTNFTGNTEPDPDINEYVEIDDEELEPNGDFTYDENDVSSPVSDGRIAAYYEGVWHCNQYDLYYQINYDGTWSEYGYDGNEIICGSSEIDNETENLIMYDPDGGYIRTLSVLDGGDLFNNDEQVSYSPSTLPEPGTEYTPSMLYGEWDFQQRPVGDVEDASYYSIGTFYIGKNGDFTYNSYDDTTVTGYISIEYDDFGGGEDRVPYYSFSGDNGFYYGFYCDQGEEGIYYEGNGGEFRLVRN